MKKVFILFLILFGRIHSQTFYIYNDSLASRSWHGKHSWDTEFNLKDSTQKNSGKYSISIQFNRGYSGFNLFTQNLNTSGYDTLVLWINGGVNGYQSFWIKISFDGKNFSNGINITDYGTIEPNKWNQFKIPLQHLIGSEKFIVSILFQENRNSPQSKFFIDEIYLTSIEGNPKILDTYFSSYNFYRGEKITVRAQVSDPDGLNDISEVLLISKNNIGSLLYQLYDDGLHSDFLANDGFYGNDINIDQSINFGENRFLIKVKDRSNKEAMIEIWVGILQNDSIPLPKGMPKYLSIGTGTISSNLSWQSSNGDACWDLGYQYITWGWWNWHDEFVKRFCDDAGRRGYIPVISVYMFQNSPADLGCSGSEYDKIYCAINNPSLMREFWNRFIQMCREAERSFAPTIIFHIEPDMLGYLQQRAIREGKTPESIPAFVDDDRYSNNLKGIHQRMVDLVRTHSPRKGLIAFHASLWGNIVSLKENEEKIIDVENLARNTAQFLLECSPDFDLIFMDWSDRDAGYDGIWWDKKNTSLPNFSRVLTFTNLLSIFTKKKIVLWQIPIGNEFLPNIPSKYADNRLDYIFDYPLDIAKSGIISLLFGAGIPQMTTQFTDDGHLKNRALNYCQNGKINLLNFDISDSTIFRPGNELIVYQNFPNPFSSFSYLRFDLPQIIESASNTILNESNLEIYIYNILGEKVATIVNERKSAGKGYEIKISSNSLNLSSGIYFLEVKYANLRRMIKIAIVQ